LAARLATIDDATRDLLAFVAFAEPLAVDTAGELRGRAPVERLERAGMIEVDDGVVRLAHPLYGEVVRAEMGAPAIARLSRALARAHPKPFDDAAAELHRVVWQVEGGVVDHPDDVLASVEYAQLHDLALARRIAEAAVKAGAGIAMRLRLADLLENEG